MARSKTAPNERFPRGVRRLDRGRRGVSGNRSSAITSVIRAVRAHGVGGGAVVRRGGCSAGSYCNVPRRLRVKTNGPRASVACAWRSYECTEQNIIRYNNYNIHCAV